MIGRRKCYSQVHFSYWEINVVVVGFGFRQGSPIIKTGQVGLVASLRQEVREIVGQGTRVSQNSSREENRLDRTLSNGHCATNAKDDIWVIAMIHQDAIIAEELAILPETVRTVRIVASLVI